MTARLSLLVGLFLIAAAPARADVSLFPLFGDHAVLQASDHVPIWGKAAPGENVSVIFGGDRAKGAATAGPDGKWTVTLDLLHAGEGPFDLVVQGAHNRVQSFDVLVGEVWLCSGQSNMGFILRNAATGPTEVATSANVMLRHFQVTREATAAPVDTIQGKWELSGPATAGAFTAVGYFFAKQIQAVTHSPVGIIHSSWGGTPVEAWTSETAFAACPDADLKAGAAKAQEVYAGFQQQMARYTSWQERLGRADRPHPDVADYTAPPKAGDPSWIPVNLPALSSAVGLPDAGAVWLQRPVTPPPGGAGKSVNLFLGDIHSYVEVYWNGRKIGAGDFTNGTENYQVNGDLRPGNNVLAIRIFEPDGGGGIAPGGARFRADIPGGTVQLAGPWLAKVEFALPALAAGQEACPPKPAVPRAKQDIASFLYNGMIAPLIPCAFRGVLWYQGESNWDRGAQYRTAFPLLINDWRARWGRGDFPFYWCQLANYQPRPPHPAESGWADVREGQTAALSLPATGQAVLIDIGEENDIHPKDKFHVGERLARIALAKDYGQKAFVWSGPVFESMAVETGGKVRLKFSHADGGLTATPIPPTFRPVSTSPETQPNVRNSPGGQLEGFQVCGADGHWSWATTADVDGENSVVVTCAEVPQPTAVRYAWANDPLCNLVNGSGLPAGPFRTDTFPLGSVKAKY